MLFLCPAGSHAPRRVAIEIGRMVGLPDQRPNEIVTSPVPASPISSGGGAAFAIGWVSKMAYLVGALLGTFVISRFFWLVTRSWPDSVKKAVVLNIICAAVVIPIDALVRDDASFSILYVVCQAVVLGYDVIRMKRTKKVAVLAGPFEQ
jgi:hypothetical protein